MSKYFSTGADLQAALEALPASKTGSFTAFDPFFYGQTYMTSYAGDLSPIEHFVQVGAARGYKPNATFDPSYYQASSADLAGLDGADLLYHFMMYGLDEGRVPNAGLASFDGNAYLEANPDVKTYVEANLSQFGGSLTNGAVAHYVKFGAAEGRAPALPTPTPSQNFALTAGAAAVDEGATATFTLTTTGVAEGTAVAYTLSGIDAADLASGALTGNAVVGADGTATISVVLAADGATEGAETLTVTLDGKTVSATTTVNDTSVLGQTFTLTNGTDTATANVFNAGQVYSPGGNDRINSLQDEDVLTGTGDNPTLNLTLGNTNDNGSLIVTPTLNGIQTINAVFSNTDGTGLDLQDATGLQALNINRISSSLSDGAVGSILAGARVELINLPATALSLDLRNSVAYADVNISYRNGELNGDETVSVDLASAAIQDLVIGAQAIQTNHINNVVLNVESESHIQNLNLKGGSTEVADQKLVINAAADFILGDDANADGNYLDDNSALWVGIAPPSDAPRLAEIEVTGAGNVTIGEVSSRAAGMILNAGTATGNIAVNVTNAAGFAASNFTTGSGNDTVVSTAGLAADLATGDGNDAVTISGGVIAATSTVDLGAGNDTLTVGATVVQNGVNVLNQNIAGSAAGGATVNFGAGDNTLNLGDVGNVSIGEEAVVTFGDGNNTVTLSGSITGDTAGLDADTLGGEMNFGAGNNTVTFDLTGQGNQATLVGGLLTAGAGTNVLNVTGNASVVAGAGLVAASAADADRVTGFQTLNLVSEQSYSAALALAVNAINPAFQVAQNDDDAATADYTVDVSEFTGLTTITLENQAGVTNATPEESLVSNRFVGDAAIYTLNNVAGTETITLTTVEAGTGIEARTAGAATLAQIAADTTADATLNLSLALNAAGNAAAVTLAGAGDVAINDTGAWSVVPAVADTHKEIQDLTLTINGADSRSVILTAGAGAAGDFRNSLTVNGDTTGTITFTGVEATTFTSSIAGNVNATFTADENHNITTGAGNDVIDLILDAANGSDTINLGDGTDRIIVNDDLRGNTGADADEYFNGWTSIEELELQGGGAATEFTGAGNVAGTMEVTLDDDAQTTGVNRVILSKDAFGVNAVVDLDIGVDFERALTIDLAEGSTINIDNDADVNLTINVDARTTPVVAAGVPGTATIALADAGAGTVAFSIRVDDVAQTIGQAATNVVITNADNTAEIDSITLLDSNTQAAGVVFTGAGMDQTGAITLTAHNTWGQAGDTLRIDASDINDDDRDVDSNGTIDNTDNQTVTINAGGAGIAYAVNVTGSQVQDTITGTAQADTIDGQAGNDTITGGVGADTLTGGAGVDTFVYTAVGDSRGVSGVDTITDFVTGTDKLQIAVTLAGAATTANLARFNNTAATVGSGLVQLDGAVGAEIIDAGYSTDGTYFIDLDGDGNINNTTDLRINVGTVNAGDINYVVTGTGGNDLIRGGQGADQITGNGGADVYVMVGSISAAQANAYQAAEIAVPGSVIPAAVANVLDISELTTVRTQSEVNAGDTLVAGGVGTLHVFGTANLALINSGNALTVGTLVVHSDITLTDAQLAALGAGSIVLAGNEPHTITVTDTTGSADTVAAILAKIAFTGQGANTTVTIVGTDGVLTAQWDPVDARLEVVTDTSGTGAAQGTAVSTLIPAAPVLSVAAAAGYVGAYSLSDTAANLAGANANVLNNATNIAATTAANVAQATTIVNATNSGTNTYNLSDTSANLAAAAAAVGNGAGTIAATDAATVAQATAIEAFTNSGANTYNIADSAANLAASSNAVLALAGTVTANTAATVAQAAIIDGFAKAVTFSVSDTAANLALATDAQLDEAAAVTASDAATVAQGVAIDTLATAVTFNVSDTAANIAGTAADGAYDEAVTITATTAATAAQAATIAGYVKAVVYSVSDTAANLLAGAGLNEAVNLTATTAATVAQAGTIEAATNTGVNTYNITDSAANLAAAGNAVLDLAGTVTANTNASVAEATTIDGFAKAVSFAVRDTAANIAGSADAALDEATSITASTDATAAESALIDALTVAVSYNVVDTAGNLAGSSSANLDEAGTVTATGQATAVEAATIAGFAKAVTFNTTDDVTDLFNNLNGAALTEARAVGTVTADDTAAALATALTSGDAELSYLVNSVEVITVNDATALTLNAQRFGNFIGGSVTLGTGEAMIVSGDASANLGTLSSYGGNGTLTLGANNDSNAYTANLGTSGVTTINLLGDGNHDVTASGSVLETFVLGDDYDGGGVLRGLTAGDLLDVDGGDAMTAFTLQQADASDVNAAGKWHFANGVLTYFDDVAAATISIGLVGVTNVLSDNSDTFTIV